MIISPALARPRPALACSRCRRARAQSDASERREVEQTRTRQHALGTLATAISAVQHPALRQIRRNGHDRGGLAVCGLAGRCCAPSSARARYVVEEGLSGRTTVHDDPIEGAHKTAGPICALPPPTTPRFDTSSFIMLGTNDLKIRFSKPPPRGGDGHGCLVHDIKGTGAGARAAPCRRSRFRPRHRRYSTTSRNGIDLLGAQANPHGWRWSSRSSRIRWRCTSSTPAEVARCSEADGFHLDARGARRARPGAGPRSSNRPVPREKG